MRQGCADIDAGRHRGASGNVDGAAASRRINKHLNHRFPHGDTARHSAQAMSSSTLYRDGDHAPHHPSNFMTQHDVRHPAIDSCSAAQLPSQPSCGSSGPPSESRRSGLGPREMIEQHAVSIRELRARICPLISDAVSISTPLSAGAGRNRNSVDLTIALRGFTTGAARRPS
eukprot:2776025-Rhodomonas_salina.1